MGAGLKAGASAVAIAVLAAATAALAAAPGVVVTSRLHKAVRWELAPGEHGCGGLDDDAATDRGTIEPGKVVKIATAADVVCFRHTAEQFPDGDWSAWQSYARPCVRNDPSLGCRERDRKAAIIVTLEPRDDEPRDD